MTLALLALSTTAFSASNDLIKGRILIETKDGVSTVELEKIVKEINGKRKQFSKANAHIIDLPSDANESDIGSSIWPVKYMRPA